MRSRSLSVGLTTASLVALVLIATATHAAAQRETVLHNFGGDDGGYPIGSLIFDAAGNLYGSTGAGGLYGNGTVFELTPTASGRWTESRLFSPISGLQGQVPCANLIFDAAGNLYGMMQQGGPGSGGTAFELTPTRRGWTEKVLHAFGTASDGWWPCGNPIFDAAGNLYGTTTLGGLYYAGILFELTPAADGRWNEKILHGFGNGADGWYPGSGLVFDKAGDLYGTTAQGGAYGHGTVFELMRTTDGRWREKILHNFNYDGADGYAPIAGLIFDGAGNLYGTTSVGGTYGYGTVFELSPQTHGSWSEKILHNFNYDGKDGFGPNAGLIRDAADNLYGTTPFGGKGTNCDYTNCGTVFELTPVAGGGWTEKVLHNFSGSGTDGYNPLAGLILDSAGNLYGTTGYGGTYGNGIVFEITP